MSRFATAKADAGVEKGKTSKPKANEITIDGLEDLSIVNAVIKQLETLQSTLKTEVNDQMLDQFVTDGLAINKKPANFPGVEGHGSGSMQLRKRTSRSTLSPSDIELLDAMGISYDESPDSLYFINKKYAEDEKLLDKVSKALDKVPGIPTDFIEATPTKYVTTEDSIDEVFKLNKKAPKTRELLQVVATLATRIKYNGDHDELMDKLAELID